MNDNSNIGHVYCVTAGTTQVQTSSNQVTYYRWPTFHSLWHAVITHQT